MTQHAEVIYETGAKSVVSIDDMDEFKAGIAEHHRRAINGESAQEGLDRPAERVKKIIIYSEHPADLAGGDNVDADAIKSLIDGMAKDGKLDGQQLTQAIRDEASPLYPQDQGKHYSMFKAEGEDLALDFLEGNGGTNV